MKKLFPFLLMAMVAIVLASCERPENLDGKIGLVAGFKYCATLTSYWVIGIVCTLICLVMGFLMFSNYKKTGSFNSWLLFLILAIFLTAWLLGPEEVGRNTSVEQANRGVYIR